MKRSLWLTIIQSVLVNNVFLALLKSHFVPEGLCSFITNWQTSKYVGLELGQGKENYQIQVLRNVKSLLSLFSIQPITIIQRNEQKCPKFGRALPRHWLTDCNISTLNVFLEWFFLQRKIDSQPLLELDWKLRKLRLLNYLSLDAIVSAEQVKLDMIMSSRNVNVKNFSSTARNRC